MVNVAVLALVLSVVSLVIALITLGRRPSTREFPDETLQEQLSGLLSEFNAAASSRVQLLEDRIEELDGLTREAESIAESLSSTIDQAEETRSLVSSGKPSMSDDSEGPRSRMDRVLKLARHGYTPAEIADETDLKPGEVSVILRLHHSGSAST